MEQVLLIRYDEIHLKGLNRPFFERKLIEGIKHSLSGLNATVHKEQGRIFVYGIAAEDRDEAVDRLTRVFGVHSISPAVGVEKDWNTIVAAARDITEKAIGSRERATFKCFCRRSDKGFFMNSEEINRELGHEMLEAFPNLSVDIREPEIKLCVEIREMAFIYAQEIMGAGGMPTGTAGLATLLISGGIDSPVAGYMMARRGLELTAVHFYSYPYTSERARDKVVDLAKIVSRYSGPIKLHLVPFTEIQLAIYEKCPPKETTVLMRRLMMKIAQLWAEKDGARALITGEALGQVASQTLESLCVTDDAVTMPVFRPLIGFDKNDIVAIAKKIDTFNTSILPYEDCCTIFTPPHPKTNPTLDEILAAEAAMPELAALETEAAENVEKIYIRMGDDELL